MDHYDVITSLTKQYAERVIGSGVDKLTIRFSKHLKYANAKCFPYRRMIVYNDKYVCLNKDNLEALRYTIIEECAHLRFLHHSEDFYKLCIELGYDVRVPPEGISFYWKYYVVCQDCHNGKFYYHKPRKDVCHKCGSNSICVTESGL